MTDSTGVFQHAIFGVPNFSEGYCTDDNARAFILAVLLGETGRGTGARAQPGHHLRGLSPSCVRHEDETLPQPHEF